MSQEFNGAYLLAAHMICADGQLHQDELALFQALGQSAKIDVGTLAQSDLILAQADEHISLDDVLQKLPASERNKALYMSAQAAHYDGVLDRAELKLLKCLQKRWELSDASLEKVLAKAKAEAQRLREDLQKADQQNMSGPAKFLTKLDAVLGQGVVDRVVDVVATASMKERFRDFRVEALLSGPAYDAAIEACKVVGLNDIAATDDGIIHTGKALQQVHATLGAKVKQIDAELGSKPAPAAREALKVMKQDRERIESIIRQELLDLQDLQAKKRRAMNYYTIAFMGRSKAGKSTLHAVVTGGGWDQIGVGKQNTTRLNRVYEWHNIRIIDTPGIATPGGEALEKVAASVIDEADLICFVVTNNNQQSSEFAFLQQLRQKGKPLLVLMNVKGDLSNSTRLRRFLEQPDQLFSNDEKQLGGHLDRIRRDAEKYYGTSNFPIVPVQLMAAQMAQQHPESPQAEALMKASRLQNFLDSVRLSLLDQGLLRRSQNLLGSTVADIQNPADVLERQSAFYLDFAKKLEERSKEADSRLRKAVNDHLRTLDSDIRSTFAELQRQVPDFAEIYWDSSESELNSAWASRLKSFDIEKRIGEAQEKAAEGFSSDVRDLLAEVGEEISLIRSMEAGTAGGGLGSQDTSAWGQKVSKWGGSLLGVIGSFMSGPVGWVVLGVGVVMGFLSSLFESAATKRRKAVAKLANALEAQISGQLQRVNAEVMGAFKSQFESGSAVVIGYFTSSIDSLKFVGETLGRGNELVMAQKSEMNRRFAARILDFAGGRPSAEGCEKLLGQIEMVDRSVGENILIHLKAGVKFKAPLDEVEAIIQEKLSVVSKGV